MAQQHKKNDTTKKPYLLQKEALFATERSLLYTTKKPSLHNEEEGVSKGNLSEVKKEVNPPMADEVIGQQY